jgi:integrase
MLAIETKKRTKRRGNGEGSIHQRPDGRWVAMLSVGYNADGQRKRRAIYGWTKREIQDELAKLQGAKIDGVLCEPSKLTVAKLLERWLDTRKKIADTTRDNYQRTIDNHIGPHIGGLSLQKLTPLHVQSLYSELQGDEAGADTCRLAHVVLRCALKQAVKWGMVVRNVCDAVERPTAAKSDITPLSAEQAGKLLAAAKADRLEALYVMAVGTGLRLGELFGLQWCDVDLKAGAVTVRHTQQELNGQLTLKEPKTAKSRRRVELPDKAVVALEDHRKRMLAEGHAASERVFCNQHGGPLRRSHFHRQDFKPLLERAELPDIRFHDLRHTSATLLLAAGVHPKIVQERLGHSQISITMDTYSHVMKGMDSEAAGRLDSILNAATKSQATPTAVAAG